LNGILSAAYNLSKSRLLATPREGYIMVTKARFPLRISLKLLHDS